MAGRRSNWASWELARMVEALIWEPYRPPPQRSTRLGMSPKERKVVPVDGPGIVQYGNAT